MDNASLCNELCKHNCSIIAVLDPDDKLIGTNVGNLQVFHLSSLMQVVSNLDPDAGIVAVPSEDAQRVADALVAAGIKAILNLTPVPLHVPSGVNVRTLDIAAELLALSFYTGRDTESGQGTRTAQD